jgi:hypothetical protein
LCQPVQFGWLGRCDLYYSHDQGMRVIDEVDVVIHALDHERAFWTDTQFLRGLSQRRAVGGINRRTLDIDARLLEKDIFIS